MGTCAQDVKIAAEKRRALLQRALDDPDFAKKRTRAAALIRAEMDSRHRIGLSGGRTKCLAAQGVVV